MKKLKKMLVLILATILLCFTLTGCGNLSATVQTYKIDEWATSVEASFWDTGTKKYEDAGDWDTINTVFDEYAIIYCGIKKSLMNAENNLISISMKIVAKENGLLYFALRNQMVGGITKQAI